MSSQPISPVAPLLAESPGGPVALRPAASQSFGSMLMNGVSQVDAKVTEADKLVRQFVVDDSVPIHQVTYALEQARLSVELMMQVRARLVEGYQEIMRMQL